MNHLRYFGWFLHLRRFFVILYLLTINPAIWSCIANFLALVSYYSYEATGEKYFPETIESVDEETLEDYFGDYKKLINSYKELSKLNNSLQDEKYLKDKVVAHYFKFLFEG